MLDLQPDTRLDAAEPDTNHAGCGSRWHVVQSHQQAERWALANLSRQGYVAYLPLCLVARRDRALRSLVHRVAVPLFPGYLFVAFDARRDTWRPICSTLGVRRLFMSESQTPTPVPIGVVEALQGGQEARERFSASTARWTPGTPCSVLLGALTGFPAAVVSVRGEQAVIAVMLFGALREVRVPVASLEARSDG